LRFISWAWLVYFFLDFLAWDVFVFPGVEIYQFLAWVDSAIAICVISVTCSELLVYTGEADSTKKGYTRYLLVGEWACLIFLVVLFGWSSKGLVNGFYQEAVNDTKKDAQILNDRIYSWEGQTQTMLRSLCSSPSLLQIMEDGGSHDTGKAQELIARYAQAIQNATCFVLNTEGNVILSTDDKEPLNTNRKSQDYFKQSITGEAFIDYLANERGKSVYCLASAPVRDHVTGKVIGVCVIKKMIPVNMVFASYTYAFLFDDEGPVLPTRTRNSS